MALDRSDGLLRLLSRMTSLAILGVGLAVTFALLSIVTMKGWSKADTRIPLGIVQSVVPFAPVDVQTPWGAGRLEVRKSHVALTFPVSAVPWWIVAVVAVLCAAYFALLLATLLHLRRILHFVEDGAAFHDQNVAHIRRLGFLIIALPLCTLVARILSALSMRRIVPAGTIEIPNGFDLNLTTLYVGMIIVVLAEVFRRGATLEREQELVV